MATLPEPFHQAMQRRLGNHFSEFLQSLNEPAPVSIRINGAKRYSSISGDAVLWARDGRYLNTRPAFTFDPFFHAGGYYVQEASSMFLEQALKQTLDLNHPLNILDLSAAPGGKSTHILSLINKNSLLVSNEVIRSRAAILAENIQKWGYPNSIVTNNDPKDFQSLPGFFDVMVIDAPCSGEGLFRKDPDAVKEWSPENVALCSGRQRRIIADAWPALKENGIFIYATCTYNESENEDNLQWLQREYEVEFLKLKTEAQWNVEESIKGDVIGYRFFPHRIKGEGFFISVMRKKEATKMIRLKTRKLLTPASIKNAATIQQWITDPAPFALLQHNEFIYFFTQSKIETADVLRQHLNIITIGTTIASVKHDKFIPDHALAMSICLKKDSFATLALSYDDAIKFLRKDVFNLPETSKGYYLITYEDAPLGWVNHLGNRYNNVYPLEWRIRASSPSYR